MDDENKVESEYIKGFNEGYIISQQMPHLAEQLAHIDSDFIRLVGFKDGRQQYQREQVKERLPTWLKGEQRTKDETTPTKSKNRGIEPDKD